MAYTLSVIILTRDEQLHIRRCIERVRPIATEIFVVDSCSTDGTQAIARSLGATVVEHPWPGLYAVQLNWALDNLPLAGDWILRLDADEYLAEETIQALPAFLESLPREVTGVTLRLGRIFLGRQMRHGLGTIRLLRLFRRGYGRCEGKLMDEHIELSGRTVDLEGTFVDHNLNDLSWWTRKHDGYALREAVDLLMANDATSKKRLYRRLPLFWRAAAYFCYRYIVRLGFLDGCEGFLWHFLQGWWYRTLVDAKILELRNICGGGGKPLGCRLAQLPAHKGHPLAGRALIAQMALLTERRAA